MKQVKFCVHSASPYTILHYMAVARLPDELGRMRTLAQEAMVGARTSHAVYAVKRYTGDNEIERLDFYNPPVCLDDKEFYERTEAEAKEHPGCLIYAVHSSK